MQQLIEMKTEVESDEPESHIFIIQTDPQTHRATHQEYLQRTRRHCKDTTWVVVDTFNLSTWVVGDSFNPLNTVVHTWQNVLSEKTKIENISWTEPLILSNSNS